MSNRKFLSNAERRRFEANKLAKANMATLPKANITMAEATKRLATVARAYHAGILEHGETGEYLVTAQTMEAVTVAAAVLGVFVEALDGSK